MDLKPLSDQVIVRTVEAEENNETSTGGFVILREEELAYLPKGRQVLRGKVLAVGDGVSDQEDRSKPLGVKAGDEVLYTDDGATMINVDGEDLLVMRKSNVLDKERVFGAHGSLKTAEFQADDPASERLAELRKGVRGNIAHLRTLAK